MPPKIQSNPSDLQATHHVKHDSQQSTASNIPGGEVRRKLTSMTDFFMHGPAEVVTQVVSYLPASTLGLFLKHPGGQDSFMGPPSDLTARLDALARIPEVLKSSYYAMGWEDTDLNNLNHPVSKQASKQASEQATHKTLLDYVATEARLSHRLERNFFVIDCNFREPIRKLFFTNAGMQLIILAKSKLHSYDFMSRKRKQFDVESANEKICVSNNGRYYVTTSLVNVNIRAVSSVYRLDGGGKSKLSYRCGGIAPNSQWAVGEVHCKEKLEIKLFRFTPALRSTYESQFSDIDMSTQQNDDHNRDLIATSQYKDDGLPADKKGYFLAECDFYQDYASHFTFEFSPNSRNLLLKLGYGNLLVFRFVPKAEIPWVLVKKLSTVVYAAFCDNDGGLLVTQRNDEERVYLNKIYRVNNQVDTELILQKEIQISRDNYLLQILPRINCRHFDYLAVNARLAQHDDPNHVFENESDRVRHSKLLMKAKDAATMCAIFPDRQAFLSPKHGGLQIISLDKLKQPRDVFKQEIFGQSVFKQKIYAEDALYSAAITPNGRRMATVRVNSDTLLQQASDERLGDVIVIDSNFLGLPIAPKYKPSY